MLLAFNNQMKINVIIARAPIKSTSTGIELIAKYAMYQLTCHYLNAYSIDSVIELSKDNRKTLL